MAAAQNETIPINVGTVIDTSILVGQIGLSCISMAFSDFYESHASYKTRIVLHNRDSDGDVVAAAASAVDLLKNVEVQAIIGPITSMEADFVINLGEKAHVPIISFSATSPALSSFRHPYFIRAALNDSSQVNAISSIVKAFGWRRAVPIYVDNEFGEGIIPFLTDALDAVNTRVPYRSVLSPSATDDQIVAELYRLMTRQTRVFIVHMAPSLGSRLFTKAKELGMMSQGYVWIVTDAIAYRLNSFDSSFISAMQGVIGVRPYVPPSTKLRSFTDRWKSTFQRDNPGILNAEMNVFGLWAYDAATALAMAVEKAGATDIGFQKPNISANSTVLETFGVSKNGPNLLQALLTTAFSGLSGQFQLADRQLQTPPFEIVNVFGSGFKQIGFWTEQNGLSGQLSSTGSNLEAAGNTNLGTIIWPGDTTTWPKGWQIPTSGKKLRVGVPAKSGFGEFVSVEKDFQTNTTTITGYCIDIFDEVIASLPYAVPYEYVSFEKPDGESAGTYDDLVHQVYLGNYDAVVGDVTIVANRSNYVEFSLPFTESGVSMFVPIQRHPNNNAWLFLKPLTWELWLTSFVSFVVIGTLIWFLEHRINEEFRGPISHQVGMVFWFAFSTMVFTQKEKIVSNLARFVLIIWFLVVLILTQAYTASLTSMITVQRLQPAVTEINYLVKNKDYVGYQRGSFVLGLLQRMGFDESRLLIYNSVDECHHLFASGRIAAAFDEIPYIRFFLSHHCSQYTMVQPTYKTDGFGFVFPIGSPLVRDISRAVLNVTESDKMMKIENKWFMQTSNCPDSSSSITSNSLGLGSFWGLFLIVGVAVFFAFVIYMGRFLHEHWVIITNPNFSLKQKTLQLARRFDDKDLSSHTFRNIDLKAATNIDHPKEQIVEAGETMDDAQMTFSPRASLQIYTAPPSPSVSSQQTDHNISFSGEQSTPSQEITDEIELGSPSQQRQTI